MPQLLSMYCMLGNIYICMLSFFSHVQLYATLWTIVCQDPLSMGFSRQEYWSGLWYLTPGYICICTYTYIYIHVRVTAVTKETQVPTMASTSIYSISNIHTKTGLCNSSLYHRIKTLLPLEYFPACQIWNQSICLFHVLWYITQNSIFTETKKLMNRTLPMFWGRSKYASLNWFYCVTCA